MRKIILGTTAYGDKYLDFFFNYCIPSLRTEGNLHALAKEREILLYIHTDQAGFNRITQELHLPVKVAATLINDVIEGEDKYLQLGRHQNQDLKEAKTIGADYHCLMPDYIYSKNCFAGILKVASDGHKAIARLCVSTTLEGICPKIEKYRNDEVISVPPVILSTLSMMHVHRGIRCWMAQNDTFPFTHILAWQSERKLRMCSPHCTPVYIANEVIQPDNSNYPLDNILDRVVIGDIYFPKPEDGIVIVDVTPENNREPNDKRIDLDNFCRVFKTNTLNSKRQLEIFCNETVDAIDREMMGGGYWNDVDISAQKDIVVRAIKERM